jgi:endonuclease/exonuclease/phosphatase family metal-dependent hydrolase
LLWPAAALFDSIPPLRDALPARRNPRLPWEGPMKRLSSLLLVIVAAIAGVYLVQSGLIKGLPLPGGPSAATTSGSVPPRVGETIRVATWNIQAFGEAKLADPSAMHVIVPVLRNFDVIAIQEVRAQNQNVLPELVALLNAGGQHHYDYCLGPRLGRSTSKEQYAFIFDMASIEVDRNQLYTVDDPDDLLHREPLVGWFRARLADPQQAQLAFTFSLVNVHTDPDEVDRELDVLDDVLFAVQGDRRREDDTIVLGDFNVNDRNLRELGKVSGLAWIVSNTPTNTRATAQYDNIFYLRTATPEFTGRGGVYDFLREFNLTLEQAVKVSDHLPVWAEFSVYEGGRAGPVAARSGSFPTD